MINSDEVLSYVQAGTLPPNSQMHFAKKEFFEEQAVFCILLFISLAAFLIWYTLNPHIIVSNGLLLNVLPGPLSRLIADHFSGLLHLDDKGLWRLIDYGLAALLGGFLLLVCVDGFHNARNAHAQFLLLLPAGALLKKEGKQPLVIEYNSLSDLFISENKTDKVKLTLINRSDGEEQEIELDKRFGNPKKLARDITRAYSAHQTMEN